MVMNRSAASGAPLLSPEEVHDLLIVPTMELSVAAQVANVVTISTASIRFPVVAADPSAAWVAEGDEIPVSDAELDEVDVTPGKVAGLTVITRELADDTSPEATEVVGNGLARDIARRVDQAFFGALTAPAPAGLASLDGTSIVQAGANWGPSLDPFAAGASLAEQQGANLTAWVASPATALALARLRTGDGSNVPLLAADPAMPSRRVIEGRPLLVSSAVADGVVWGIPGDRVHLVIRDEARVDVDGSVYFTSDRVAVRATARVGFAFPHEAAVVQVALDGALA